MHLLNVCDANLLVMKTKYDHRPCDKLGTSINVDVDDILLNTKKVKNSLLSSLV